MNTQVETLNDITDGGLLVPRHNTAAKDALLPIHRKVGLTSLFEDLESAGLDPETKLLDFTLGLADAETANLLECDEGTEVVQLKRLRYSRGYPLAILNNILLASKTPCRPKLSERGLYQCFRAMGCTPESAFQYTGARRASKEEAELLQIEEGSAVIAVERTVYSQTGEVIDIEEDVYDASQYLLTFSLDAE
ncbi:MAG: UTRA domain-containing protein [Ancrocorticia sp.]